MKRWGMIFLIAILVALILSPFASSYPDGLEKVSQNLAFAKKAVNSLFRFSPMPEYTISGISNGKISTALAGVVGTVTTFAVSFGVMKGLARKR